MGIIEAIILGIVQGITEFLPISSSAHLLLIPHIFGWQEVPASFEVALHFGTLIAIVVIFYKDWLEMLSAVWQSMRARQAKRKIEAEVSQKAKIFGYLVLATVLVAGVAKVLDEPREALKSSSVIVYVIAGSLIVMGLLLYFVDQKRKSTVNFKNMTMKTALIVGLSQIIALIPGMSRSGTTITTARMMEVNKKDAARYSFLLATPVIFAATVLKVKEFEMTAPFILGVLASFISGLFVLKFFMKYLETKDYKVFAIYRCVLGVVLIALSLLAVI